MKDGYVKLDVYINRTNEVTLFTLAGYKMGCKIWGTHSAMAQWDVYA